MVHNPLRPQDVKKNRNVLTSLADWLTRKTNVELSNHLYPKKYD